MTLAYYFKIPFADAGDKLAIPQPTQGDGSVSYNVGFGPDYELPYSNANSKDIPRNQSNQLWNSITTAIKEYQENGIPDWITDAQNGGTPFPYPLHATIRYTDGLIYQSASAGNVTVPGVSSTWVPQTGRLIARRVFSSVGTTVYTPTPGTKFIIAQVLGGGGTGGGAVATTAGQVSAGGGGSGGSYAEALITSGFAGVTITIGAGGAASAGASNGPNGSATSFGAIVVAPGGLGGTVGGPSIAGTTLSGAAAGSPANASGGNLFGMVGQPGGHGIALTGSGAGGGGGSSPMGQGGFGKTTVGGLSGSGYGAGSSGALSINGTAAQAAPAAQQGVVIISEYQ